MRDTPRVREWWSTGYRRGEPGDYQDHPCAHQDMKKLIQNAVRDNTNKEQDMHIHYMKSLLPLALLTGAGQAVAMTSDEGYYASAKWVHSEQNASNLDTSSRPGVGQFVGGKEKDRLNSASLAAGYQYGNGWRTEGEYTSRQKTEFTSGSTAFPASFNHLHLNTERIMLNVYRDYEIGYGVSLFGTAGVGVAKVKAGGWQGNTAREYADSTQHNFAYSLGAGVSYSPVDRLIVDIGYRYVDMGKIESGYNTFGNVRGLKDEQMKARLASGEFAVGTRYLF